MCCAAFIIPSDVSLLVNTTVTVEVGTVTIDTLKGALVLELVVKVVGVAIRPAVAVGVGEGVFVGVGVGVGVGVRSVGQGAASTLITTASRPATGTKISSTCIVECSSVSHR